MILWPPTFLPHRTKYPIRASIACIDVSRGKCLKGLSTYGITMGCSRIRITYTWLQDRQLSFASRTFRIWNSLCETDEKGHATNVRHTSKQDITRPDPAKPPFALSPNIIERTRRLLASDGIQPPELITHICGLQVLASMPFYSHS